MRGSRLYSLAKTAQGRDSDPSLMVKESNVVFSRCFILHLPIRKDISVLKRQVRQRENSPLPTQRLGMLEEQPERISDPLEAPQRLSGTKRQNHKTAFFKAGVELLPGRDATLKSHSYFLYWY